MFPVSAEYPVRERTPVTWGIIALCGAVWLYQAMIGPAEGQLLIDRLGVHPALVVHAAFPLNDDSLRILSTLVSSQFVHAGFLHLAFNMLFFHVFAQAIEVRMGSWRFAGFYLLCGVAAGLTHSFCNPQSMVPLVGASGAVAGVLGAHAVLLPWDRIRMPWTLMGPKSYPAWSFTLLWFLMQFVQAIDERSDVAWLAHVGGVLAGILLAPLFRQPGYPIFGRSEGDMLKEDAAALPTGTPPPEPPLPEVPLSQWASSGLAVVVIALVAGSIVLVRANADAAARSRALEWRALAHLGGVMLRIDPPRGAEEYRRAAELGDPDVQYRFAERLRQGRGMPLDAAEAMRWTVRAATAGHPLAMERYGLALIDGEAVPRDTAAGIAMLQAVADRGYASSNVLLGMAREAGAGGIPVDFARAAAHYEKACNNSEWRESRTVGRAQGCYRLARLLQHGKVAGAPPDAARSFMRRAADEGDPDACDAWGLWLATGDPESADIGPGATENDAVASRYFQRAADRGNADAMYNLARLIDLKRTDADPGTAQELYRKSAAAGSAKAKAVLARQNGQ